MKRKSLLIGAGIAAVAAAGLAVVLLQQRAAHHREIIAVSIPQKPALGGRPQLLQERIDWSAQRALAGTEAIASLGELSRLYHANGFFDEAMQCYTGLEQLEPREALWLHRHATILAGYGQAEPALERWRRVAELAPEHTPARIRLGDLLVKMNRLSEAEDVYAKILQRDPKESYALLGLARCDIESGRWEEARDRLEIVVAQTNYVLGYDLIVTVYEHFGQTARAAAVRAQSRASGAYRDPPDAWMDVLLDDCFDPYRLSLAAGTIARAGDSPGALRLLERALRIAPDDVSVNFQIAGLHLMNRTYDKARFHFERCTTLAPEFADGWAHLSGLLETIGDRAGAEGTLATGLVRCPESPGLHIMRARNLRRAGRKQEAIAAFETSIRLRSNEADAYLELAAVLFELNRAPEGVERLLQALDAEPDHPTALSFLAFHAITAGDESAARQWLARVRNQPRVPQNQVERLLTAFREKFGRAP